MLQPVPSQETSALPPLRRGEFLGKYRLVRRLGAGGYSEVWRALDTIEGIPVALKMPYRPAYGTKLLEEFRHEARILARLDHPNILRLKNADIIGRRLVLAYELGTESLDDRMVRRYTTPWAIEVARQLFEALAAAHEKNIVHRDVKPENIVLFENDRVRLGDFCIARLAETLHTRETSSGTLGFMAPEQAYGKPTFSSDVFSAGLVLYQLLTGQLPSWPFQWPYPGHEALARKVPREMVSVIRRATAFRPRGRYPNAGRMLAAFSYAMSKYKRFEAAKRQAKRKKAASPAREESNGNGRAQARWQEIRVREFEKRFRRRYGLHFACRKCGHPIGEAMAYCPGCGTGDNSFRDTTAYPAYCPSCERGVRLEWKYCPWCFQGRFTDAKPRPHRDHRYTERCANPSCPDRRMMPFMRYCPWCKTKVKRPPKRQAGEKPCPHCHWPVAEGFWNHCAWCGKKLT